MRARLVHGVIVALVVGLGVGCRRGGGSTTGPSDDLTGTWSGTSTYPNAPFSMSLRHDGARLSGSYRDRLDAGSVSGTVNGVEVLLDVNFGDTGIRFTARVESRTRIAGEILVPALGGQRFPFTMSR